MNPSQSYSALPGNLVASSNDYKPKFIIHGFEIDAEGCTYKGKRIEDAGEALTAFMHMLCKNANPMLKVDLDAGTLSVDTGAQLPQPEGECKCTFAQRMQGDGCDVCNPELAREIKLADIERIRDELNEWSELERQLAEARMKISALESERIDLVTTMIAAAEEIQEHWSAHCDEEGYGPSNLMTRLERGVSAGYPGYSAGQFTKLEQERDQLRAELAELKREQAMQQLVDLSQEMGLYDAKGDGLYVRLESLSKSLEGSGRIDEHEQPGAYATVLDAMNFVRSALAGETIPDEKEGKQ
jgi:hypothetical protein